MGEQDESIFGSHSTEPAMVSVLFSGFYVIRREKKIISIDKEKEEKLGSILLSEVKEEAVAEEFDPWKYWTFSFDSQFK